jgi:serine/threonine protein phosphatase 1
MGDRTFVVGDVHGCSKTFERLLDVARLDRTDTLFLIGDLVDRGSDSKVVIEAIIQLQRDGFDIRPIRGNHEMMLISAARTGVFDDLLLWLHNGGDATLKSYGVSHPAEIPSEHLAFLEGLPYFRMTQEYLFVHAGLDFSLDDPLSVGGRTAMLWTRDSTVNPKKIGGRTLVTGHTTQTLDEIRKSLSTKHIWTDNGCHLGTGFTEGKGNLVAVNLVTKELIVQPNIDGADRDHH